MHRIFELIRTVVGYDEFVSKNYVSHELTSIEQINKCQFDVLIFVMHYCSMNVLSCLSFLNDSAHFGSNRGDLHDGSRMSFQVGIITVSFSVWINVTVCTGRSRGYIILCHHNFHEQCLLLCC
jgi:hypothetical protein